MLCCTGAYAIRFPCRCTLGLTGELNLKREEKGRDGKERELREEKVEIAEELIHGQCLLSGPLIL